MKLRLIAIVAAIGVGLAPGSSSIASADEKDAASAAPKESTLSAEVVILHATNDNTGIDSKIGKMPELEKPPFSSYNSYKLLDRKTLPISKEKSSTVKLPNDRELMISLKDIILPKKKDEPKKYVVGASIQKPGGNTFLPLLEVNAKAGEIFFVAGQTYKGGVLVIGIKVNP